ncbi:MAG: hypothetical protein OXC91_02645 [Rhodobacteraceae bacterium]|nr:hypothetical protein [Paracoccaceae bacterium]
MNRIEIASRTRDDLIGVVQRKADCLVRDETGRAKRMTVWEAKVVWKANDRVLWYAGTWKSEKHATRAAKNKLAAY